MNDVVPNGSGPESKGSGEPDHDKHVPVDSLGYMDVVDSRSNLPGVPEVPREVYAIILDEYRKNKRIKISSLYNKIRRNTKFKPREIMIILKTLLKTKFIKENSPLIKEVVLESEKRSIIFKHVSEMPGIHFNLLKSLVDIGTKMLEHHVSILLDFGLIKEEYIDSKRCFYSATTDMQHKHFFHFMHNDKIRHVVVLLLERDDNTLTVQDIANATGIGYTTVNYYIKKMEQYNFLEMQGTTSPHKYRLTHEVIGLLARYKPLLKL